MPRAPSPLQVALSFLILVTFAAMLATLIRLAVLAWQGGLRLDDRPGRRGRVPWDWRSVVLVVATFFAAQFTVVSAYSAVRERFHVRVGPAAAPGPKEATKGREPTKGGPVRPDEAPKPVEIAATTTRDEPKLSFTEQMFLVSVVNALLIAVIPALLRWTSGARWGDLALTTDRPARDVRLGLLAFLAVTPCVMAVNLLAVLAWRPAGHPLEGMLREGLTPGGIALAYLSAVVLAPVAEELMFRGILQGWLDRLQQPPDPPATDALAEILRGEAEPQAAYPAEPQATYPVEARSRWLPRFPDVPSFHPGSTPKRSSLPIVLTSLAFAVVHAPQMPAPIAIFFLSLALGWLVEVTGSLVPSIVLHAAFNGFNTTLMVLAILALPPNHDVIKKIEPPALLPENRVEKNTFRLAPGVTAVKFSKD
jgi:membrane protease YdiL (CAAX protease family)